MQCARKRHAESLFRDDFVYINTNLHLFVMPRSIFAKFLNKMILSHGHTHYNKNSHVRSGRGSLGYMKLSEDITLFS